MAVAGSDSTVTDETQPAASLFSVLTDRREVVAVDADRTAALYFNTGSSKTEKHSTDCWKQTQHTNTVTLTGNILVLGDIGHCTFGVTKVAKQ